MVSDLEDTYQWAYDQLLQSGRRWQFDGVKAIPTYDDVRLLLNRMIEQVRKSPSSISLESGGLLVKRTDNYIDVYVHIGGIK